MVFGALPDGRSVRLWTLDNGRGLRVRAMEYGAAITSIEVPDREGKVADVALGFDTLEAYREHTSCLGAVVGRYANRIRDGRFTLDGREYRLPLLPSGIHLHGGPKGFDKCVWTGDSIVDSCSVRFRLVSPDGDQGYPGDCRVSVTYSVTDANELTVDFEATTDRATPINLSQHTYFNLAGYDGGSVLDHRVTLRASRFTTVDDIVTPTGEIRSVAGTPLDFRNETPIGARIDDDYEQLKKAGGYDHNFVVDRDGEGLCAVARVVDPKSGRTLTVRSTEPGVQFYTANFLDGSYVGKQGVRLERRHGFCLETQHFPDSPNHPAFPSTVLRPGETLRSHTVFAFGVA
jgi:aldose 1-epimerase